MKDKIMSEEPTPKNKKFSLWESVARIICVSIILAIIVNAIVLCVIARIIGQSRG